MSGSTLAPKPLVVGLSAVTGILLGACLLLAAKVYHPLPRVIDTSYQDLLGTPMPEFALKRLDGTPISTQVFQGIPHLVIFASAGCSACDSVYPQLKEVSNTVQVLMIADTRESMQTKAVEQGFAFPIAYDSSAAVQDSLKVRGVPTAMFIDAQGVIVQATTGGGPSFERVMGSAQVVVAQERGTP